MKRKLIPLMMVACGILSLASCLDDGSDIVYSDDTAITSFTLGTLNQYLHTKSKSGRDSVYRKTVDCSDWPFYIDNIKNEIYNPDSLPKGIDASKVVCTVVTKNSGQIGIKSMTSDTLRVFSSSDSTDFSQPRDFYIYSNAGTSYRRYTVRVNVHKEDADSFVWRRMGTNAELAALQGMKAVAAGERLLVFGSNGTSTLVYASDNGSDWNNVTSAVGATLSADAYKGVVKKAEQIYIYDNGQVMTTADGNTWVVAATAQLSRLVAASSFRLYAYDTDGRLVESSDDGTTWTLCLTDDADNLLPTSDISYICAEMPSNVDTERVVIVGNRDAATYPQDTTAVVWGRVDESSQNSESQPWTYYTVSPENRYKSPRLNNMQVASYDKCIVALGGSSIGKGNHSAFDKFYRSGDGGITWRTDTVVTLPRGFEADENSFALTDGADNFLWLVCGKSGQVWRGRTNRLGWKEEEYIFTE